MCSVSATARLTASALTIEQGALYPALYRDRTVVVKILSDGFEYDGRRYGSLSAVARVQYKRMSEGRLGAEYRPGNDPSHDKELQRMLAAEKVLGELPKMKEAGTSDFRLSGRPFYIKLCAP